MGRKIVARQPNSRMCLVCGMKNDFGLKTSFHELEGGELLATFQARDEHQSYPGRLHGGIVSTILDETIGRAILVGSEEEIWGVTVDLQVRFKKPVPLDRELRVLARITKQNRRFFEGSGELLLPDGTVAATGSGRYLKTPLEQIADFDAEAEEWRVLEDPADPEEVEI
ncbi:MAG: PaaI family thioesterase [Deltaproteobacteria bacterium]|nr:PaaI family thioesterase [Deltaproteobacteria bacterium]